MLACHAAVMVIDRLSETVSQTPVKYFLVYAASVMVSLHNNRKVAKMSIIKDSEKSSAWLCTSLSTATIRMTEIVKCKLWVQYLTNCLWLMSPSIWNFRYEYPLYRRSKQSSICGDSMFTYILLNIRHCLCGHITVRITGPLALQTISIVLCGS